MIFRPINYHYVILHREDDDGWLFTRKIIKAPVITARAELNYDPDINSPQTVEVNNNGDEIRALVRLAAIKSTSPLLRSN